MLGEEELLEHEPDPARAQRRQLPVRQARHVQTGDLHRAGAGPVQAAHHVQQRGLARPRRAHHRHQLPRRHGQAHLAAARSPAAHWGRSWSPGRPPAPRGHAPPRVADAAPSAGRPTPLIGRAPRRAARPPARTRTPAPGPPRRRTTPASPAPGGACRRRRRPPPRTRRRRAPAARVTGTASTLCTVWSVIATSTGAWSRLPVAARIGGPDVHRHRRPAVGRRRRPELFDGAVATLPTEVTRAGRGAAVRQRDRDPVTGLDLGLQVRHPARRSPSAPSNSHAAPARSRARRGCAGSVVTRAAVGRNTTSPSDSSPVWSTPRCFCSFSTPALVAQLNSSQAESTSAVSDVPQRDQVVVQLRHVRPGHVRGGRALGEGCGRPAWLRTAAPPAPRPPGTAPDPGGSPAPTVGSHVTVPGARPNTV